MEILIEKKLELTEKTKVRFEFSTPKLGQNN